MRISFRVFDFRQTNYTRWEILLTYRSRRPQVRSGDVSKNQTWDGSESEYEVLNIPINVDAWYFRKEKSEDTDAVEWMLPVRLIKESLLENIRYVLIKKNLRRYPGKSERKIDPKKIKASVSRD